MRILVVAAHPDDEILGVGGALAAHVARGDEVHVCMVTRAWEPKWSRAYIENKRRESARVDRLLKIKRRHFLDFETARTGLVPSGEFNAQIAAVIEKVAPDRVYTHFAEDVHDDHRHIFRAVLVGTRPTERRRVELFSFETPSSTEWSQAGFKPNFYVDISRFLRKKLKAFAVYKSEVRKPPHPRSLAGVKALAAQRGAEICAPYAEAFQVVRGYGR